MNKKFRTILCWIAIFTSLAITFQVLHLFEHFLQVGSWLFVQKDYTYMSPIGMATMHFLGNLFFPTESMARIDLLGKEVTHLIGNIIFLLGITGLFFFIKKSKKLLLAFWIQAFHVYEHISLTVSAIYINKSIGFSTLFGSISDPAFSVAFRVWWHFIFDLVPTILVLWVVHKYLKNKKLYSKIKKFHLPQV